MQAQEPPQSNGERESRILLGVAGGVGCLLLVCLLTSALAVLLALVWTLQGNLGPATGWLEALLAGALATGAWL